MLPEPARRLTKTLNASVFSRHEKVFRCCNKVNVNVVPLDEEPGEEDHRDDRDHQYDTGDEACCPRCKMADRVPPSRRIGRVGLRGGSCRFVSGLQWLGRTFITRHAAVLPLNQR